MSRRLRRTKIVTTLGPATDRDNNLEKVIAAGANVVRMNFSHGSPEDHKMRADKVREIAAKYGFDIWSGEENDNEDPLTGAVQKITSEEASALAGQLTMVRIKQDQMTAYLGDQLVHLIGIRENTAKTVDRLDQILSKIEGNNVINSLRSKGL